MSESQSSNFVSPIWRDTEHTLREKPCTCIDGRTAGERYSVAGGSIGLILSVLSALQERREKNLSVEQIAEYLDLFADQISPVYLHTDQHMLDTLFARLGLSPDSRLDKLTTAQQRSFSELAVLPENQGCGHLKLLMSQSADYQVPRLLAERVLQAFFQRYFAGRAGYQFDVLAGEHRESAAVILEHQSDEDEDHADIPLYGSTDDERFFCHRPVKSLLVRRFLAAIERAGLPGLPAETAKPLIQAHDRAAELTLVQLAPHLPVDRIHW